MKRIFIKIFFFLFSLSLFATVCASVPYDIQSAAFFYGLQPDFKKLRAYDVVVIDPRANVNPKTFFQDQRLVAYVSLGEIERNQNEKMPKQWILGYNPIWHADILDQTNEKWQEYFLTKIIAPLWEKGYRGFFLDTIDSFKIAEHDLTKQTQQLKAIEKMIKLIRKHYPDTIIIMNRGFELLPTIHEDVDAVAAESLFSSWDEKNHRYISVGSEDRNYLLKQFELLKQWSLPFIAIDYVDPNNRDQARLLAAKIHQLGIIPWITDGRLQTYGTSHLQNIPRKVLVMYSKIKESSLFDPSAFLLFAMPLEYLGWTPIFQSVTAPFPQDISHDQYAAVVVWAETYKKLEQDRLFNWLLQIKQKHIPIIFMGSFGFSQTSEHLAAFGLVGNSKFEFNNKNKILISKIQHNIVGFEAKVFPQPYDFFPLRAPDGDVLLSLQANGVQQDAIAIMPWGGYVLNPYVFLNLPNDELLWVIHPIKWLQKIFSAMKLPVPDVTTENGRRLFFAHIDGDSFASPVSWNYRKMAAEIIRDEILKVYPIPTTVSVVTSDFSLNGLNPQRKEQLTKIAKSIFELPWVEPASHTFSHPFDWILVQHQKKLGEFNLPIKGYTYSAEAEILGSMQFMNENLLPKNKKAKFLLWSGYANPDAHALALVDEYSFYNLNGGDTDINIEHHAWSHISPLGLNQEGHFQVYSPMTNEELYTNNWTHPFDGFKHVIETFKLTDQDYRFKPINIYYHFYSGEKSAGLRALKQVYDWALQQEIFPIYASGYVEKVRSFNQANLSRFEDGFQVRSNEIREIRVPQSWGFPDLMRSKNVIGYKDIHQDRYIHLGDANKAILYFSKQPSASPFLVDANAQVKQFKRDSESMSFKLTGNLPIDFRLANMQKCTLEQAGTLIEGRVELNGIMHYHLNAKDSNVLRIVCQK